MRWLVLSTKIRTGPALVVLGVLNLIHPVLHGTALDGGAIDAALTHLNLLAVSTNERNNLA